MKSFITPSYTFTPGLSGVGTVNLSGISSFDVKKLVAIINQTRGVTIYATGAASLRYTNVASTTVTLFADTSTHNAADVLQVIYQDINSVILQSSAGVDIAIEATNSDAEAVKTTASVLATESYLKQFNGTTWDRVRGDITSGLWAQLKASIPAGTNVIGKTGYKLVKVAANFTRPSDTAAYAIGDVISNSTSVPSVFQLDLGAAGAVNGQATEIRKLCVVSSIKQSTLPLLNVYLSNATFTATNDNSALDITDASMEDGGAWFACETQNYTASNSRVAYFGCAQPLILAAADSKLYGAIQAANAYTPGNQEKFTVIAWVALL